MQRESARGHGRFDEKISNTLFFIGINFVCRIENIEAKICEILGILNLQRI